MQDKSSRAGLELRSLTRSSCVFSFLFLLLSLLATEGSKAVDTLPERRHTKASTKALEAIPHFTSSSIIKKGEGRCILSHSSNCGEKPVLYILVSSSLPTVHSLFKEAHKLGGVLVFRGLIDHSFRQTQHYFTDVQIQATIDPALFEEYGIKAVPTFVLKEGKSYDLVQGHIPLREALSLFKEQGELKEAASHLLKQLQSQ